MNTFVVIASGPSLTVEQCEAVRLWRVCNLGRVIVVNRSFRRALWADYLYACDDTYLQTDIEEIKQSFKGEIWTQDYRAANAYGLKQITLRRGAGLCREKGAIHHGGISRTGGVGAGNSGYQAVNLAYHWGATKIILLGFDMQRNKEGNDHWHEPHAFGNIPPYGWWVRCFEDLAADLGNIGVEVVNATPETALYCFPQVNLLEHLRDEEKERFKDALEYSYR